MKKNLFILLLTALLVSLLLFPGCGSSEDSEKEPDGSVNKSEEPAKTDESAKTEEATNTDESAKADESAKTDEATDNTEDTVDESVNETGEKITMEELFSGMTYAKSYKGLTATNPLMSQRFGADPYALVYGDRVYFYMTADAFETDIAGNIKENSYSQIASLNVISTNDMVNFTDHGSIQVGGSKGAAKWAKNSWAPAAAWKNIDGKDKFFLYFADNGGGIGVLTADSPTGPFTDPLGHALISRSTPTCASVLWLFDPAVLVDDDGRAYIYFGGGVPEGMVPNPGTGRVAELGEDMISLKGDPVPLDVPYLFEDSGIHKYNNKYYYTYCTNWNVDAEGTAKYGFVNGEIACLESDSPMGPFTYKEKILENPGKYCGLGGNNHHCVFSFMDRWYITYHNRSVEKAMGVQKGYRSTNIDEFTMGEDGTIGIIKQTTLDREQLRYVDPYEENSAVNMAVEAGLNTVATSENGQEYMVLTEIDSGDYIKIMGVDFGDASPKSISAFVTANVPDSTAAIKVTLDRPHGEVLGYIAVSNAADELTENGFAKATTELISEVTGVHDICFVFSGNGYEVKSWSFGK